MPVYKIVIVNYNTQGNSLRGYKTMDGRPVLSVTVKAKSSLDALRTVMKTRVECAEYLRHLFGTCEYGEQVEAAIVFGSLEYLNPNHENMIKPLLERIRKWFIKEIIEPENEDEDLKYFKKYAAKMKLIEEERMIAQWWFTECAKWQSLTNAVYEADLDMINALTPKELDKLISVVRSKFIVRRV